MKRMMSAGFLVIFGLLGCSDTITKAGEEWGFDEPGARQQDSAVNACLDFAEARCQRLDDCGLLGQPSTANDGRRYVDREMCLERERLGCHAELAYHGQVAIERCGEQLSDQDCAVVAEDHRFMKAPRCLRADAGEACESRTDCLSGRCSEEGLCEEIYLPLVGQACDAGRECQWWSQCEAGACQPNPRHLCVEDCSHEVEVAEWACGSAVDEDGWKEGCSAGAECMRRNDMGAGECVEYAAEGESCGGPYEYEGKPCLWPARCMGDDEDARCRLP